MCGVHKSGKMMVLNSLHQAHLPDRRHITHWGRVMHICVSKLTTIGSNNGLSPDWRQAIIWTNAVMLLIRNLGTNFSDFSSEIWAFSFKKILLKVSSGKCWPACFGLNVLNHYNDVIMSAMASQITSLTIVYWTIYLGTDHRKHQSSASLAFVRRIHRWPVNSRTNGQ